MICLKVCTDLLSEATLNPNVLIMVMSMSTERPHGGIASQNNADNMAAACLTDVSIGLFYLLSKTALVKSIDCIGYILFQ